MGANEKQETTYHGEEYTPDEDAVESAYVHHRSHRVTLIEAHHEFNRAIARIKAEAKAEALNKAASEIDRLDSDVEMYDENLNATQVTFWLRTRANQIKDK